MPTISIIIPTFNRENLLPRAINSALNQTFKETEIIIVDDNSTDQTQALVQNYQHSNPSIIYKKLTAHNGAAAARNIGIHLAKGDYIAFLDSDDEWERTKLQKQLDHLKNTSSNIVYTKFRLITNDKEEFVPLVDNPEIRTGHIHQELLKANFITTSTLLIKKEYLIKTGLFNESLNRLQDWDLVLRLSKQQPFSYIPDVLVTCYLQHDNISLNRSELVNALETIFRQYTSEIHGNPNLLDAYYINIGSNCFFAGQMKKGRMYILKIVKKHPKWWGHILLSFLGKTIYTKLVK